MRAYFPERQLQPFDGSTGKRYHNPNSYGYKTSLKPSSGNPKDDRGEENTRGNIFQDADGG